MIVTTYFHKPVLLPAVIAGLDIKKDKKYIDATLGGGGYALEIVKKGGIVLGLDFDQEAIDFVKEKVKERGLVLNKDIFLVQGNFADIREIASKNGFSKVQGVIFDLGMSSYQLEQSRRGFSFQKEEPLDMRMDKTRAVTAAELVNKCSEEELYEIFVKNAEELNSRTIAKFIVRTRSLKGPIDSAKSLGQIIEESLKRNNAKWDSWEGKKILQKTKTRIFQALRMAVNEEIDNLKQGLKDGFALLDKGGRIAVLSYHSLEDRIVKQQFKELVQKGLALQIGKPLITADYQEIAINNKAKSAKLRIIQKTYEN